MVRSPLAVVVVITPNVRFNCGGQGSPDADLDDWWALACFGGRLGTAVAMTTWGRSPVRAGTGELISRARWLGWPDRLLPRIAGAWRAAPFTVVPSRAVAVVASTPGEDRVASLKARQAALERWRASKRRCA